MASKSELTALPAKSAAVARQNGPLDQKVAMWSHELSGEDLDHGCPPLCIAVGAPKGCVFFWGKTVEQSLSFSEINKQINIYAGFLQRVSAQRRESPSFSIFGDL
jgi:hypothetical protein